jgi:hypothetical protein
MDTSNDEQEIDRPTVFFGKFLEIPRCDRGGSENYIQEVCVRGRKLRYVLTYPMSRKPETVRPALSKVAREDVKRNW